MKTLKYCGGGELQFGVKLVTPYDQEKIVKTFSSYFVTGRHYHIVTIGSMKYYISKTIKSDFDQAVEVTESLKKAGFGVLSEIDIGEKLKEKLEKVMASL